MRNFLKEWWFALVMGVLVVLCFTIVAVIEFSTPSTPVAEKTPTECLDGFEYYARTFSTHHGIGVALAPKWDRDGKPKRCAVERSDAPH